MSTFFAMHAAVRTAPRACASVYAPRAFATASVLQKSATETVKSTLKTVDRAVSGKIVDGIEIGEKATEKVQEVTGMGAGEAKGKAKEVAGQASGMAAEYSGKAKGTTAEMTGKAKSMKEETKAEIKRS